MKDILSFNLYLGINDKHSFVNFPKSDYIVPILSNNIKLALYFIHKAGDFLGLNFYIYYLNYIQKKDFLL